MQEASSFVPLFVNEEGQPYRFYIWNCAERKRVKELIEVRFGKVTKDPEGDYTIQLADPETCTPGEVYSIYYITECCSLGKLLDLRHYRLNATSKYEAAFCPMDVLQGHITWMDADVFSLENESSPNRSTATSEASVKRRKVSSTTSTDEEALVIEHINERQKRSTSDGLYTPKRGFRSLRRKSPYKLREKEAIVQYLKKHKAYKSIKGTAIWKNMEEDKVCANRTWQSLKEHFLKHILPDAEAFDFSTLELALLKKITSSTRRKDTGDNNAASQNSDDDDAASLVSGNRYTPEEDEAILKYISCDRRYLRAGGIKIWQRMERRNVVPGRSWQSLKERYRKNVVHRLNAYVNKDELDRMETWIKGPSRSTKGCTCCAKSKSPPTTVASGDTSITSSSELSPNYSLHHKRKLFTQRNSSVQFTPVCENHQRPRGISALAKQTATACINNIQVISGNTVQHKMSAGSPNCKGNAIRKVVSKEVLLAKKKILPTVNKNKGCLENKEKTTPTKWTQNDSQQVNHFSSSSVETSVVVNRGTLGKKNASSLSSTEALALANCDTLEEKNHSSLSSTETSVLTNCGTREEKNHSSSLSSSETYVVNCGNLEEKNHSSLLSSTETSVVMNSGTLGEKNHSSLLSSTEMSVVANCGTLGEKNHSSLSSTETSVVANCGILGEKNHSSSLSSSETYVVNCGNIEEKNHSSSLSSTETSVVMNSGTLGEKNHSSLLSSTEMSVVANCGTLGEKNHSSLSSTETSVVANCGILGEKNHSSLLSSTETSVVANCGALGEKNHSSLLSSIETLVVENCGTLGEKNHSSLLSSTETSVVANCGTLGEKNHSSLLSSTETSVVANCGTLGEKNHSSLLSSTETSVVANCGTLGEKDLNVVSETSFASEGQKCISSTSSDAGLGTSLTDINKESVPECDQLSAETENIGSGSDNVRSSQKTVDMSSEIVPPTTVHEVHKSDSENSFFVNDPQLQQMADTPTQDKQLDSTSLENIANATGNICSSNGDLEGGDTGYSPEKKQSVSPSNCALDISQDDVGTVSEPSSVEAHLHASDEQLRKPETQDACCLEPLSFADAARVNDVNTAPTSLESSKHPKHYNSPVAVTPQSVSVHQPPVPEASMLAKSIQFLYWDNLATTNTTSDSSERHKKPISNKSKMHKGTEVASKIKKIDKTAKMPEKSRKRKLEDVKEKDHLMSSETSPVRNLNSEANKAQKNPFSCTSLESFIYQHNKSIKNMKRSNVENKKGTCDKTSNLQLMETHQIQAVPSCSKNSDINCFSDSNQKTDTSVQEKEITLSNNESTTFRKTKHKQLMETDKIQAVPSCSKNSDINCFSDSNQKTDTSVQEKEITLSNNESTTFRKTKHKQLMETDKIQAVPSCSKNSDINYFSDSNQETGTCVQEKEITLSNNESTTFRKTNHKQLMKTHQIQAVPSCSKNSDINYFSDSNQETGTCVQEKEITLSNNESTTFRKTNHKQLMKTHQIQAVPSCSKNSDINYFSDSNQETGTCVQEKEITLSNNESTTFRKTNHKQLMKTHQIQAVPSCSKNSDINYFSDSNQETGTCVQEKEITLSNIQNTKFRKIKHKQKSSLKHKMKSCQINVTEDMDGIPDDTNSGGLHVKVNETRAPPSCLKTTNYSAKSNQMANILMQEKETILSNNQDIPSAKTKHTEKSSSKNRKKSSQTCPTDVRSKVIDKSGTQDTKESLKSNKNILNVTASNSNLHKDDITILDMEEIIPKETNFESSEEILSEHSKTHTDPKELIHSLTSADQNKNDSSSMPGKVDINVFTVFQENDHEILFPFQVLDNKKTPTQIGKSTEIDEGFSVNSYKKTNTHNVGCQVVCSPSKDASAVSAVQVCEISNSNVDITHTQKTSTFHSKSNISESSLVHNSNSSLSAGSVLLIQKNGDSSLLKGIPNQKIENQECVLCSESDNDTEHTNMSQKTPQELKSIIPETPEAAQNLF